MNRSGAAADLAALSAEGRSPKDGIDWDVLVRRARRTGLLGRLACILDAKGEFQEVPEPARRHLDGALRVAQRQAEAVRWEVSCIREALCGIGVRVILLKGAAYVMAGLPPAGGRLMSDIDILVPRAELARVESALMVAGWATTHHQPYDQHYYRAWMHELPPMRHIVRGSAVDVHHALLPITARISVDTESMRQAAVPIAGRSGLFMLCPTDLVLHAAAHLFHESEWRSGLRDLSDLDLLLRHFGATPRFWDELAGRGVEVGLGRPLHYALTCCARLLGTPVPGVVATSVHRLGPRQPLRACMSSLFERALAGRLPEEEGPLEPLARALLFLRGHWLRMPAHLLAYHLGHKTLAAIGGRPEAPSDKPAP